MCRRRVEYVLLYVILPCVAHEINFRPDQISSNYSRVSNQNSVGRNSAKLRNCAQLFSYCAELCAKLRGIEQKLQGSKMRASKIPCVGNPKLKSVIHWCINCRITFSNCTEITTVLWNEKTTFALLYKSIYHTNKRKEWNNLIF